MPKRTQLGGKMGTPVNRLASRTASTMTANVKPVGCNRRVETGFMLEGFWGTNGDKNREVNPGSREV